MGNPTYTAQDVQIKLLTWFGSENKMVDKIFKDRHELLNGKRKRSREF